MIGDTIVKTVAKRTTTIVIAGTATGVGKTLATMGLAGALGKRGARVVAIKPIESGCSGSTPGSDEDGVRLARATGQRAPPAALLRLRQPVAPPVAAEAEGVEIDLPRLLSLTQELGQGSELLLVEGAGGLLSPLTWTHTLLDVAHALEARVLLVAPNALGVINHVRLAVRVLASEGLDLVAVLLFGGDATDPSCVSNSQSLRRILPEIPLFAVGAVTSPEQAVVAMQEVAERLLEEIIL